MSRFTTYAIKEISSSFLLLLVLLSGILWLGQGLRHIELLTSDNVSFISYLSYIVHLHMPIVDNSCKFKVRKLFLSNYLLT